MSDEAHRQEGLTEAARIDLSAQLHEVLGETRRDKSAEWPEFDPDLHGYACELDKAMGLLPLASKEGLHPALTSVCMDDGDSIWVMDIRWPGRNGDVKMLKAMHEDLLVLVTDCVRSALLKREIEPRLVS